MVMAKLHVICGNCGCADLWELTIERDGDDISSDHEAYEDSASLYCGNCSTLHNLKDSAKKVTFGSGATSPVPAQQPAAESPWQFITNENWNIPKFGQRVILFSNGVIQEESYTLDQGDSDFGGGGYFWNRDDLDECPEVKAGDAWMPWPDQRPEFAGGG